MRGKKILLIDDDEDSNFLNSWIIKRGFAEVIECYQSAQEALIFLKNNSEKPDKLPDFIFLDLRMPLMDGFGFIAEFEKLPETILNKCKIVVLTSSFDKEDYLRVSRNKYVIGFLNKPLTFEALENFK